MLENELSPKFHDQLLALTDKFVNELTIGAQLEESEVEKSANKCSTVINWSAITVSIQPSLDDDIRDTI